MEAILTLAAVLGFDANVDNKGRVWLFFNDETSHLIEASNSFFNVESWNYGPAKKTRRDYIDQTMMESMVALELRTYAAAHKEA